MISKLDLQASQRETQRVAVIHDWLTTNTGAERVLEQILQCYPTADLYSLVDSLSSAERTFLNGRQVRTSFLQRIPFGKTIFRKLLWLLPAAVESFDLSEYNLVISSSFAVAKGVITGPDQLHICYCHSPIRYAWDLQHEYLTQARLTSGLSSIYARAALHYLRIWDVRTANGVDRFVANSEFIARRIRKVYRRKSTIIHPPVDLGRFQLQEFKEDYYITVSRLVPYKRVDLVVEAFTQMPNRRLIVIGGGAGLRALKARAGRNIEFLGSQSGSIVPALVSRAKAFVFAAREDFGIAVVEAQAAGTPVICFGKGGVLDTVIPGKTGVFFHEQSASGIKCAVERFEAMRHRFDPVYIRTHAEKFSPENFRRKFQEFVREQTEYRDAVREINVGNLV